MKKRLEGYNINSIIRETCNLRVEDIEDSIKSAMRALEDAEMVAEDMYRDLQEHYNDTMYPIFAQDVHDALYDALVNVDYAKSQLDEIRYLMG